MTNERTATSQVLYPSMRYTDAHAAIAWLGQAFGLTKNIVHEGPDGLVAHAELALDGALIMIGNVREGGDYPAKSPRQLGGITGSIYAYVADLDAHCARARSAGATIAMEPYDTGYGTREYSAVDPEGYWWTFGTYRP